MDKRLRGQQSDSMTNAGIAATRVAEYEDVVPPSNPDLGGVAFVGSPWDYGLGLDMTHEAVAAANPMVWPQDDGNIG